MSIEVGEYVRTKNGIDKIKDINYCDDFPYSFNEYELKNYPYFVYDYDIIKHSKNIKDLIEDGDYVNGKKVKINYESGILEIPKKIKSIVTKEQFTSMEYRLKEECK